MILLFLLLLLVPAWANPAETPDYPPATPPRAGTAKALPAEAGARSVRMRLEPGWNLISFPFARVLGTKGFEWQLLDGTTAIDPGVNPERLSAARAFWAYTQQPAQVEAVGLPNPGDRPGGVQLQAGWNAVGCPFDRPIDLTRATCAEPPRALEAAVHQNLLNDHAFRFEEGQVAAMPLDRARLLPYAGHWIYASQPVFLRYNLTGEAPVVTGLKAEAGELLVEGRGFGSEGTLWAGCDQLNPTSWSATQIRVKAPSQVGSLRVVRAGLASNTVDLPAATPSEVTGQVLDDDGQPVSGARVWIDGGDPVQTDAQGNFSMAGLSAGAHQVRAALGAEEPIRSLLELVPGLGRRVVLTLPSRRGDLSVRAYSYTWNNCTWRPHRILVWERGNYSRRYRKDFWYDWGWSGYNLDWYRLPLGRTYEIQVTWKDPKGNYSSVTRWRRLTSAQHIEYVYNSWTY